MTEGVVKQELKNRAYTFSVAIIHFIGEEMEKRKNLLFPGGSIVAFSNLDRSKYR